MQLLLASLLSLASFAAAEEPCSHPEVVPVVEIGDWIYDLDNPPQVGEPAGDGICELYCGLEVVDPDQWIPQCSSYSCRFTLQKPDGSSTSTPIQFGPPHFDGMTQPTAVGTVCGGWSESMPPGRYRATLECGSSSATFDFEIVRSHPAGFEIPSTLRLEDNPCPRQPAFDPSGREPEEVIAKELAAFIVGDQGKYPPFGALPGSGNPKT